MIVLVSVYEDSSSILISWRSARVATAKLQQGCFTKKSGSWIGHFSRWPVDPAGGKKRRRQYSRQLGPIAQLSKRQRCQWPSLSIATALLIDHFGDEQDFDFVVVMLRVPK
jgi:hypothetical protein